MSEQHACSLVIRNHLVISSFSVVSRGLDVVIRSRFRLVVVGKDGTLRSKV